MAANLNVLVILMFLWLLVLTVAFVMHWIKVERHMDFGKQWGTKVSDSLRGKVIGKG